MVCTHRYLIDVVMSLSLLSLELIGAYVIGTASTEEKANKAKACGADEVILYSQKDFVEEVRKITEGAGVNVIYDGVGKATFDKGKSRPSVY